MELSILAFGIAKDIVGTDRLSMEIEEGADTCALKKKLEAVYPAFTRLKSYMLAVNREYAPDTLPLSPRDEIAIIPPVSGG